MLILTVGSIGPTGIDFVAFESSAGAAGGELRGDSSSSPEDSDSPSGTFAKILSGPKAGGVVRDGTFTLVLETTIAATRQPPRLMTKSPVGSRFPDD